MLATEILKQDHEQAISLVDSLEGVISDERGHRDTFRLLSEALELHMREEEEIFYPALIQHDEFSDLMEENVPEHEMVRANLAQMSELSPASDSFQSILTETKIALAAHMTHEENVLFPRSIEVLGDERMRDLGNEIDQLKGEAGLTRSATL